MYNTSIEFHNKIQRNEKPFPLVLIETDLGERVYSEKSFPDVWDLSSILADGSVLADGSTLADGGGFGFLEQSPRLLRVSAPSRTISPKKVGLLLAFTRKQQGILQVQLANTDLHFSKLLAKEPFLTKSLSLYCNFPDLPFSESLLLFKGVIEKVSSTSSALSLEVVETSKNLGEEFTLSRSGRYSSPLNTNALLPIVYGDLSDGDNGNWILPCIDTANYVYCFSDSEVLSAANGNSIDIYVDNVLESPSNYTFDESDNYESEGIISTITFNSDQSNSVVSARGKGKALGSSLIENVVDILEDFLTVHNNYTSSDFEPTQKAMARDDFESNNYSAAGVINQDQKLWDIVQDMMSSFLGSIYLNALGLITLKIDKTSNFIPNSSSIIPKGDLILKNSYQEKVSLVNVIPASYSYNYLNQEFNSFTDDSSFYNLISRSIYGDSNLTNYQFYWCRDKTAVNDMQEIITTKYGNPLWQVEIEDITLKRVHIDVGDFLTVTIPELYDKDGSAYVNQFMQVLSVTPNIQKQKVSFRLLDTGFFRTDSQIIADGTYLADGSVLAGGDRDTTIY